MDMEGRWPWKPSPWHIKAMKPFPNNNNPLLYLNKIFLYLRGATWKLFTWDKSKLSIIRESLDGSLNVMKRLSGVIMHLTVNSYHHGVSVLQNENIKPMSREILNTRPGQLIFIVKFSFILYAKHCKVKTVFSMT